MLATSIVSTLAEDDEAAVEKAKDAAVDFFMDTAAASELSSILRRLEDDDGDVTMSLSLVSFSSLRDNATGGAGGGEELIVSPLDDAIDL